jgi:hypothetical protein
MKIIPDALVLASSLFVVGCASAGGTFQNRERIEHVEAWQVVYSSRVVDTGFLNTEPASPVIQARAIQASGEPEVPQKVLSILQNRFSVRFTDDTTLAYPQMRVSAGVYPNGEFRYLDVVLLDAESSNIGHTRVYNERERENMYRFNGAFAEYAADKIAELVSVR